MGNDDSPILKYKKAFKKYEEDYIKDVYNPNQHDKLHHGYFVDNNDYLKFKKVVEEKSTPEGQNTQMANTENNNIINIFESMRLDTISLIQAKNIDLSTKKLRLINNDLGELICKRDLMGKIANELKYQISYVELKFTPYLIVSQKEVKIQYQNPKNNIIDSSTFPQVIPPNNDDNNKINNSSTNTIKITNDIKNNNDNTNNTNVQNASDNNNKTGVNEKNKPNSTGQNAESAVVWKMIYKDVKNYNDNKKEITGKLNQSNQEPPYSAFLVDNEWFDNWKSLSHYDELENIVSDTNNEKFIGVKNKILKGQTKEQYDNIKKDIEKYILQDENKIKSKLTTENKSYVLLNNKFLGEFINNDFIKPFKFHLFDNQIKINLKNNQTLSFKTKDNIINKENLAPDNTINEYNSECLYHLIRFPLFKINLKFPANSLNEAYLVNRKITFVLIEFYHIKEIFCVLERNQIIDEKIKYQESDKYYPNISKYLKQNQISYITDMKQFETGGFMDIKNIDTNFINKSVNNKYYIDDFELIDGKFFSFFVSQNI